MPVSYPVRPSRHTRRRLLAGLAAALVTAGALTGCSGDDGPEAAVEAFLGGWRSGDLQAVGFIQPAGGRVAAGEVTKQLQALAGELAANPPELTRTGEITTKGDVATARVKVSWALPGGARWAYENPVRLKRGGDDQPIVAPRPVVRVQVVPGEVTDVPGLVKKLDAAFKAIRPALSPPVDLGDLPKRLKEAKPDGLVEVVTLREDAYRQIKPRIYELPGTRFATDQLML
ncbi:penicillin-binding protein, partial [Micromonospora chalcea]